MPSRLTAYYSPNGQGADSYFKLVRAAASRICQPGPVQTSDFYDVVRRDLGGVSYSMASACFTSAMTVLRENGEVRKLKMGRYIVLSNIDPSVLTNKAKPKDPIVPMAITSRPRLEPFFSKVYNCYLFPGRDL
jgi:hypothetical protein